MSVTCQASALAVGTFSLQLTASAGEGSCANSTTKDITITVDPKPNITLTGPLAVTVCAVQSTITLNYTVQSSVEPVTLSVPAYCNISGRGSSTSGKQGPRSLCIYTVDEQPDFEGCNSPTCDIAFCQCLLSIELLAHHVGSSKSLLYCPSTRGISEEGRRNVHTFGHMLQVVQV